MTSEQQYAISSPSQDQRQHEEAARLDQNSDFRYSAPVAPFPYKPDGNSPQSWIFDRKGNGEITRRLLSLCGEVYRDGRELETPPPGSAPSQPDLPVATANDTGKRPEAESWVQLVTNACKNSGDTPVIIMAPARIEKSILSSIEPIEPRE